MARKDDDEGGMVEVRGRGEPELEVEEGRDEGEEVVLEADEGEGEHKGPGRKPGKDDADERVGAGREREEGGRDQRAQETEDQRRERRRIEKKDAKERRRRAMERDKAEMRLMENLLGQQQAEIAELRRGQHRTEAATVDQRIGFLEGKLAEADEVLAAAIEAQNGADVVKVTRIRDDLQANLQQLKNHKARTVDAAKRSQNSTASAPNPALVAEAIAFQKRNSWFDAQGTDEDSAVVLALDNVLSRDRKFDPTTPAYWEELEKRARKRIPHRFKDNGADSDYDDPDDDADDDDDEPSSRRGAGGDARQGQRRGGGPRIPGGGSGNGGGKNTFYLSAERRRALEDAGVWDDPKLRNKYIRKFKEWDDQNASRGR